MRPTQAWRCADWRNCRPQPHPDCSCCWPACISRPGQSPCPQLSDGSQPAVTFRHSPGRVLGWAHPGRSQAPHPTRSAHCYLALSPGRGRWACLGQSKGPPPYMIGPLFSFAITRPGKMGASRPGQGCHHPPPDAANPPLLLVTTRSGKMEVSRPGRGWRVQQLRGLVWAMPRPGNAPLPPPLLRPAPPGRSASPAGAQLAGSAIERRVVWASPRPGTPLPFFTLRHLVDLPPRPGRGWRVQQLRGGW